MPGIVENILIMVLTIVVLVAGGYATLVVLGWLFKRKHGGQEEQGLTDLWIANQPKNLENNPDAPDSNDES